LTVDRSQRLRVVVNRNHIRHTVGIAVDVSRTTVEEGEAPTEATTTVKVSPTVVMVVVMSKVLTVPFSPVLVTVVSMVSVMTMMPVVFATLELASFKVATLMVIPFLMTTLVVFPFVEATLFLATFEAIAAEAGVANFRACRLSTDAGVPSTIAVVVFVTDLAAPFVAAAMKTTAIATPASVESARPSSAAAAIETTRSAAAPAKSTSTTAPFPSAGVGFFDVHGKGQGEGHSRDDQCFVESFHGYAPRFVLYFLLFVFVVGLFPITCQAGEWSICYNEIRKNVNRYSAKRNATGGSLLRFARSRFCFLRHA